MNVIRHNLSAINVSRQLNINSKSKEKISERLASGYRINRAADDAAGLSISENMRIQIRGLNRARDNTMEGISLCQVADGALAEVQDMLQRINELSVQAANDTNTREDRQAIQNEIDQIIEEVDRVADATMFNTIPLFKGTDTVVADSNGNPIIKSDINVAEIELAEINLGKVPFGTGDHGDKLGLQAIAKSHDNVTWNLIFGNGSTSSSSFVLKYDDGTGTEKSCQVKMRSLTSSNCHVENNDTWIRDFAYTNQDGVDITIRQKVKTVEVNENEKNYEISYEVINNNSKNLEIDFMFHADTAYNNNDRCEGYYTNGNRIDKFCVYSKADSPYTNGTSSSNVINNIPDSFSIIDVDKALSFSEKITIDAANQPDSLSIGFYNYIDEWDYYEQIRNNTNSQLGENSSSKDLGFSMLWNKSLGGNTSQLFNFKYGIISANKDNNLQNVTIKKDNTVTVNHSDKKKFWIQSGSQKDVGMFIDIDEMNSSTLGIRSLSVTNHSNAERAIDNVKVALELVSKIRSNIGAEQNRLEHTQAYVANTAENTTAAESRIRDYDMADGMVNYSMYNILCQAGQSVLAQANQITQQVLSLFQ